jgi:hypothetical protein
MTVLGDVPYSRIGLVRSAWLRAGLRQQGKTSFLGANPGLTPGAIDISPLRGSSRHAARHSSVFFIA